MEFSSTENASTFCGGAEGTAPGFVARNVQHDSDDKRFGEHIHASYDQFHATYRHRRSSIIIRIAYERDEKMQKENTRVAIRTTKINI